jgi:hypothetical protein
VSTQPFSPVRQVGRDVISVMIAGTDSVPFIDLWLRKRTELSIFLPSQVGSPFIGDCVYDSSSRCLES